MNKSLDRTSAKNTIFETKSKPFGIAQYIENRRISDFVGRDIQMQEFKDKLYLISDTGISRGFRLEGPSGVGKSTLFGYVKQQISEERQKEKGIVHYLSEHHDILSVYFKAPRHIFNFAEIWKNLNDHIRHNFLNEVGKNISLPEYVALQLIKTLSNNFLSEIKNILWPNKIGALNPKDITLKKIHNSFRKKAFQKTQDLKNFYRIHQWEIQDLFNHKTTSQTYEISFADTPMIFQLFGCLYYEDPNAYLDDLLNGKKKIFPSDDDIIKYYNSLLRIYACCIHKLPILLIGIDEFAKSPLEGKVNFYSNLGKIFIDWRNILKSTLFVFISTDEDWHDFDECLREKIHLTDQISEFMTPMVLAPLSIDKCINIFQNRMDIFWQSYSDRRPSDQRYYPFNEKIFEYVYRYHRKEIRSSIHKLHELWKYFRRKKKIPEFNTYFDCFRFILQLSGKEMDLTQFREYDWEYIRNAFEKDPEFQDNQKRSTKVELGLKNAWLCLQKEKFIDISSVQKNPRIYFADGHYRQPDIYLRFFDYLSEENRRKVEFQVKMYLPNSYIKLKEIESSLELFEMKYTDYLHFIITGQGFHPIARQKVEELQRRFKARIFFPILLPDQINHLYLLALYKKIFGHQIGDFPELDKEICNICIEIILNRTIPQLKQDLRELSYRQPLKIESFIENEDDEDTSGEEEEEEEEEDVNEDDDETETVDIDTIKWLNNFPDFNEFKYELCALCEYLSHFKGEKRYKFYPPTILSKVITLNSSLDKNVFEKLMDFLKIKNFIKKVKRSWIFAGEGLNLYDAIEQDEFEF